MYSRSRRSDGGWGSVASCLSVGRDFGMPGMGCHAGLSGCGLHLIKVSSPLSLGVVPWWRP